jgi:serine/threonine protein phosphatase PrpC
MKELSERHLLSVDTELSRIQGLGVSVNEGRLNGLTISRAFGDLALSKQGIIHEPYICDYTIESDDKFVVLASDGVWDVVDPSEIVTIISPYLTADEMAKALVHMAYKRESKDNITAIVVCL